MNRTSEITIMSFKDCPGLSYFFVDCYEEGRYAGTARRAPGAGPVQPAMVIHSPFPTRSLGRFTVMMDRKGGPVSFGFVLGSMDSDYRMARSAPLQTIINWTSRDVLCWVNRGDVVKVVEEALEARNLPGLTQSERKQLEVLDYPAEDMVAPHPGVRVGRNMMRVALMGGRD